MDDLNFLQNLNWYEFFITLVALVLAGKFLYKTFIEDIIVKHGWESAKMKQKREDHELLIKTSQNLALLQDKHKKDEHGLEVALETFMSEVRDSFNDVNTKIEGFYENQSKYRGQSLEIQKQFTTSIKELTDAQNKRDEQISALMCGSKELLGNTIDERYSRYVELGGIPQNEVDDFDDIYSAYRLLKGNHGRQTKYEYVKQHLSVIPVKTELVIYHE